MTRQRFGQHFLSDPGWRERIAHALCVSPGRLDPAASRTCCWLEIGAGHGEMTELLLRTGLSVVAVELDPSLVKHLHRLAKTYPQLSVVPADILSTDLAALAAGLRLRIYGNLPYYITSPILHHLFRFASLIDEIHLVIQFEVARRLTAHPGNKLYGYLSVLTRFYSRPEYVLRLPPGAFRPPPEVSSALVTLRLPGDDQGLPAAEAPAFLEFVKSCFAQKRKTLANNLRSRGGPSRVRSVLRELRLREDARAEQLTVAEFIALFQAIS